MHQDSCANASNSRQVINQILFWTNEIPFGIIESDIARRNQLLESPATREPSVLSMGSVDGMVELTSGISTNRRFSL